MDEHNADSEEQSVENPFAGLSFMQITMLNAHEVYQTARTAGFNRGQALYLTACVITGGARPPLGAESGSD